MTLIRDEHQAVPLGVGRDVPVLYLSLVDYPTGWQMGAPSRTLVPALRKRWSEVTAVELSDQSPPAEVALVRSMAPRFGAIVASVFVRTANSSGRMDLSPALLRLLSDLARDTDQAKPFVTTFFGNPYVAAALPELPAVLLTYDLYDLPEAAVAKALSGEASISGRLPITLSPSLPIGFGLERSGPAGSSAAQR